MGKHLTNSEGHLTDNDDALADQRLEQVLDALKSQDKNALKALFSKKALKEAVDYDSNMDYLFSFFQGSVESYEYKGASYYDPIENGVVVQRKYYTWYHVVTDKQDYYFILIDYQTDKKSPDNQGLYTLRVIIADVENPHFSWDDVEQAGIYKP